MRYKVVLSVEAHGDKEQRKVLQAVTSRPRIDHIWTEKVGKKLTVTVVGNMDPIDLGNKLRKHWHTDMVRMSPVEEPKKEIVPAKKEIVPAKKEIVPAKKEIVPAKKIDKENLPKNREKDREIIKKPVVKKEPEIRGKEVRVREREVIYQVFH